MNALQVTLIVIAAIWVSVSTTLYLIVTTMEWEKKTFIGWLSSLLFPLVLILEFWDIIKEKMK